MKQSEQSDGDEGTCISVHSWAGEAIGGLWQRSDKIGCGWYRGPCGCRWGVGGRCAEQKCCVSLQLSAAGELG